MYTSNTKGITESIWAVNSGFFSKLKTNKQKQQQHPDSKLLLNLKPMEYAMYFVLIKMEVYCQIQQVHRIIKKQE